MQIEEKATILTAESKPYDFQGRSGVSHKVRLNIGGEIFSVKATEALVNELQKNLSKVGTATLKLSSPKENLKVELVSFVPTK